MNVRSIIKNDLWQINYIVPFAKKYLASEKRKADQVRHIMQIYQTIHPVKGKGKKRTVGGDTKELLSRVEISVPKKGFVYFLDTTKTIAVPGNVFNNFTIDYDKLIHHSFNERLGEVLEDNKPSDEYGNEIRLVAEGIDNLRSRILKAVENSDMSEEDRVKRISDFENLLSRPAINFEEALQRILFFNQVMWQTRHRLNGLGRMDYYLSDYYEKDIASGQLSPDDADQLLDDFFLKLTEYFDYKSDALAGDIGQIIVLGGLGQDGTYFFSELTEKLLRAQARANVPDPKTILRTSEKMPKELMEIAVDCLKAKTGSPMFANDDTVIPLLLEFGLPEEDAYNYCVSACWEPYIVGKSFEQNNMATYDFSSAFDEVMKRCSDIGSFEELVERYIAYNNQKFDAFLININRQKWAKDPIVSFLTDDCNTKRKDISEGGARYVNYGITTVGLANVVDSLFNIRHFVFEEKKYTLQQLAEIRKHNFSGENELYEFCRKRKYYGRDDRETVDLVNRITKSQSEIAEKYRNQYGGTIKFGLSSPGYNTSCKKKPGDFSGRKAGAPYNTHISCLAAGYTEVVNFAGQLEYGNQRFNGNVVDFFVNPSLLDDNRDKFVLFMMLAIKQGFFEIQMNVMDSKTLIDAKAHPEKYPGLIVRVWGMSSYFNDLPESYKNLLIERAIAAEKVA